VAGSNRVGAIFTFDPSNTRVDRRELQNKRQANGYVVESRIGVSFISTAKACGYIDNEIPKSTGAFQSLVQAVKDTWVKNVFSVLTTTDKDPSMLRLLYSSIYGMFLIPSDRSGENPLWSSSEPYVCIFLLPASTTTCADLGA
jgi:putative alpha-1,2-mannosidase